jgi:hypothetical protein
MMPLRVFVSYRRGDSGHAGRLYDALASRFGPENVFMDIDTIEPGLDFAEVIDRAVQACDVVIVLIGPRWVTATDTDGRRRLDNAEDFVRLEIEAALARDVVVIPTCVQGADMPPVRELPPTLVGLTRRQGIALRDIGWHDDVSRLIRRLERLAEGETPKDTISTTKRVASRSRKRLALIGGIVGVAAIAVIAAVVALTRSSGGGSGSAGFSASERRLLAVVPPLTRSSCQHISYGEKSARASVSCSGVRVSVIYNEFATDADMNAWFAQQRELVRIQPESGSCTPTDFRGERAYDAAGRKAGRYLCFFDSRRQANLVWTDRRVRVGAASNVYEGKGRATAQSLLRQWRCCLQPQP